MAPRALKMLLEHGEGVEVKASMFEMSSSRVRDLFGAEVDTEPTIVDNSSGQVHVKDVSSVEIRTVEQFASLLAKGMQAKSKEQAAMPGGNNRSHSFLSLSVKNKQVSPNSSLNIKSETLGSSLDKSWFAKTLFHEPSSSAHVELQLQTRSFASSKALTLASFQAGQGGQAQSCRSCRE